jgi:type II secretion system protein C
MNRYQREVAEIDRRHQLFIRTLSFAGAAILIVVALWSAGLPPSEWLRRTQAWLSESNKRTDEGATAIAAPAQAPSAQPASAPAPSAELSAGTDSSVSASPQPLFLVATSPGRNKNEGTALIGTNPDSPQTYVGGAMLVNGARLAEIHRDYVLLSRGDDSARLELYRRSKPSPPISSALLHVGGEQPARLPVAETREILTDYVRPSPVYDGEVLRGYEVYPGAKSGVFARLGLESGDLITAIDDSPLSDAQQAMELFGQLTRGVAVVATVVRKTARRRVTLDGALITADQEASRNSTVQVAPIAGLPPI